MPRPQSLAYRAELPARMATSSSSSRANNRRGESWIAVDPSNPAHLVERCQSFSFTARDKLEGLWMSL
jgi:hypothetical protein